MNTSRAYLKLLGIVLCYLLILTFLTPSPRIIRADEDFTATQNGDWNNTATWGGGGTPTASARVTVPAGITVTIPGTLTVDRTQTTTINGTLDNNGIIANMSTISGSGNITNYATIDNNATLSIGGTLTNNSILTNNGTLTNNATFANFGTFSNNSHFTNAGTLNNIGFMTNDDSATAFINNGTINNSGSFYQVCGAPYSGNLLQDKPARSNCAGATLAFPMHRAHITDDMPTFSWNEVGGADAYRLRIYTETRSYVDTVLVNGGTTTSYTWHTNLTSGKYLWRVRVRDASIPAWGNFSKRNTFFID
jgi:hypothetical protein